jgi:hypothetical protein
MRMPRGEERTVPGARGVTMVLQWCYNGVTVVLHWCHNENAVVLQLCYSSDKEEWDGETRNERRERIGEHRGIRGYLACES